MASDTMHLSRTSQNILESLPEIVKPMTAPKTKQDEEREAVIKIQVAINKHKIRKRSKLRERMHNVQDRYLEAANETQHE